MNFQNWFIKFGGSTLPNSFILEDGWDCTPNQRVELEAWRDANVDLHRTTGAHTKSSIKIAIKPLTGSQREILKKLIDDATISAEDELQRRVVCTYWNDEDLTYTTGTFYIADINYKVKRVNDYGTDVRYQSFNIELTEY